MVNIMAKNKTAPVTAENASVESVAAAVETAIETTNVVATVAVVVSKASLARSIWDAELAAQTASGVAMSRKAIVDRFVAEAGLTLKGARTYFQNFREKANMVVKRSDAVVTEVTTSTPEATA